MEALCSVAEKEDGKMNTFSFFRKTKRVEKISFSARREESSKERKIFQKKVLNKMQNFVGAKRVRRERERVAEQSL